MTKITRNLPNNQYQAALLANNPSSSNVFATMADVNVTPRTVFISKLGNDTTGKLENGKFHFVTFMGAKNAILAFAGGNTDLIVGWTFKYLKTTHDANEIHTEVLDFTDFPMGFTIELPRNYFILNNNSNDDVPFLNVVTTHSYIIIGGTLNRSGSPSTTNSPFARSVTFIDVKAINAYVCNGLYKCNILGTYMYYPTIITVSNGYGLNQPYYVSNSVTIRNTGNYGIYMPIHSIDGRVDIETVGGHAFSRNRSVITNSKLKSIGYDTIYVENDYYDAKYINCEIITDGGSSNIQGYVPQRTRAEFIQCFFENMTDSEGAVNIDGHYIQQYRFKDCSFKIVPNDAEDRANVKSGFTYQYFSNCKFNVSANQITDEDTVYNLYRFSGTPIIGDVLKYKLTPYTGTTWDAPTGSYWEHTVADDGSGNPESLDVIIDAIVSNINSRPTTDYLSKFKASRYNDGTYDYLVLELKYIGYIYKHLADHTLQAGSTVGIAPTSWRKNGYGTLNQLASGTVNIIDVNNINKNIQINKYIETTATERGNLNIEP